MSFYAKLTFDGGRSDGYVVIAAKVGFGQSTDDKGRPSSLVRGSLIAVRMASDEDTEALKWMLDPFDLRNGKIQFFRSDQASVMKEIAFTNGYCIRNRETFQPSGREGSLYTDIYISPESTTVNGVTHKNIW